jgi:hypothetical protein
MREKCRRRVKVPKLSAGLVFGTCKPQTRNADFFFHSGFKSRKKNTDIVHLSVLLYLYPQLQVDGWQIKNTISKITSLRLPSLNKTKFLDWEKGSFQVE